MAAASQLRAVPSHERVRSAAVERPSIRYDGAGDDVDGCCDGDTGCGPSEEKRPPQSRPVPHHLQLYSQYLILRE